MSYVGPMKVDIPDEMIRRFVEAHRAHDDIDRELTARTRGGESVTTLADTYDRADRAWRAAECEHRKIIAIVDQALGHLTKTERALGIVRDQITRLFDGASPP